ncbi:MAG TPA: type I methionyl aminopeptidase [Candidatus Moranbacteria bacterium]|nr:type I methionyl aminopeptidase [Candidatus Moranbacteria bacterium]
MKKSSYRAEDVPGMTRAGALLAEVMAVVAAEVRPGTDTEYLDQVAEREIRARGAKPAFLGYDVGGEYFPGTICACINEELVHGPPVPKKVLREGDIFSVDMGLVLDGFFADMARTLPVGKISPRAEKLLRTVEEAFWVGVENLRAGKRLADYAGPLQRFVQERGFGVVRDLVSHGIGRELHQEPKIPNYLGGNCPDFVFRENMTVALEPMITAGDWRVKTAADGFTFVTADGSLSAHYENTVLIEKDGVKVLTATEGL